VRRILAPVLAIVIAACGQNATPAPTPAPAANVPCGPTEVFERHDHAHLTIVVRGQIRQVPANIGITATQICWLHTHDPSGVIHMEAGDDRTLALGDFFALWRQTRGQTALDAEPARTGETIQTTVNQQAFSLAPERIVLSAHQDIVIQLGPPFVQIAPYVWPPGL
jgi:hypothetical protein